MPMSEFEAERQELLGRIEELEARLAAKDQEIAEWKNVADHRALTANEDLRRREGAEFDRQKLAALLVAKERQIAALKEQIRNRAAYGMSQRPVE